MYVHTYNIHTYIHRYIHTYIPGRFVESTGLGHLVQLQTHWSPSVSRECSCDYWTLFCPVHWSVLSCCSLPKQNNDPKTAPQSLQIALIVDIAPSQSVRMKQINCLFMQQYAYAYK